MKHITKPVQLSARRRRPVLAALTFVLGLIIFLPASPAAADEGAQIVGGQAVPWPVAPETCDPAATGTVDYILAFADGSGDLSGCLYGVRGDGAVTPGGQVSMRADEVFVGCLGDRCGSFALEAHITSRWDGLPGVGDQINGRCQHKIVSGSGTGDFAGVEGRLDFVDILERDDDGNLISLSFDYRGHLRFG